MALQNERLARDSQIVGDSRQFADRGSHEVVGWTVACSMPAPNQSRTEKRGPMSNFAFREPASGVIEVAEVVDASSEESSESRVMPVRAKPRSMADVVGDAPSMLDLYEMGGRVAATTCTGLITGESGTGKELRPPAVHETRPRPDRPFVAVNSAPIPEALLESAPFG